MKWFLKQLKSAWSWLMSRSSERWFYLCLGLVIGAFFAIALKVEWVILPVAIIGFIIEFVRQWVTNKFDWKNLASVSIGGLLIFLIQLI